MIQAKSALSSPTTPAPVNRPLIFHKYNAVKQDGVKLASIEDIRRAVNSVQGSLTALNHVLDTADGKALRRRAERLNTLMLRGDPTSAEILEADFGTKNPNGLDIDSYPRLGNRVFSLTETDYYKGTNLLGKYWERKTLGGRGGVDDKIYMHPRYLRTWLPKLSDRDIASTFVHEHTHRLQGWERRSSLNSVFNNRLMKDIVAPEKRDSIKGVLRWLYQQFSQTIADEDAFHTTHFRVSDYFSEEAEMQARLHEIMAHGYAVWQRMPVTKIELWAALHNLGLATPRSIMQEIQSTPEGQKALKDFRSFSDDAGIRSSIDDLNRVYNYVTLSVRKTVLWTNVYPYLYGNLLENYGDKPGRKRMGLPGISQNTRQFVHAIFNDPESLTENKIGFMTAQIPADEAQSLAAHLLYYMNSVLSSEKGAAIKSCMTRTINSLLVRSDFKAILKQDYTGFWDTPLFQSDPLMMALIEGHTDIADSLLKAGANPFRKQTLQSSFSDHSFELNPPLQHALFCLDMNNKRLSGHPSSLPVQDEEDRNETEIQRDKIRRGLEFFAQNYTALDQAVSVTDDNGVEKQTTARQMLEEAGIKTPVKSDPTTIPNSRQTL